MYYSSRAEAGYRLAQELMKYRYENTFVVALSDGAVQLGTQIAAELHCGIAMFLAEDIDVPGENLLFGEVNQGGGLTYNGKLSESQIGDYYAEFHSSIDAQKREKVSRMNRLLGDGGIVNEEMLREHNVIVVSDGLGDGGVLEAVADFLKPVKILRLIIAAPIASVEAVDRAHIIGDELHILGVTDNYLDTDHYYDANDVPSHDEIVQTLNEIIMKWR